MAAVLVFEQTIRANQGSPLVKGLNKFSLPASGLGGVELFSASGAPNVYLPLSDDGNSWNPLEGPDDYDAGYTTRLIAFSAKSGNADDITVVGMDVNVVLRPGSGFMLSSPYEHGTQDAVTDSSLITVSGADEDDLYSAIWAVG